MVRYPLARAVLFAAGAWIFTAPANAADAALPTKGPIYQAPAAPQFGGWYIDASLDGVFARRNHSNAVIIQDTTTTASVLTGDQLGFGNKSGLDARLRIGFDAWSVEGRYFGGFKFNSSAAVTTPAIWNFPTTPPLFGLGVANVANTYDTSFHSWEANLRWRANSHIVVFAGGRWISTPETLNVNANFGGNQANISWDSSLKASGPQIGAEIRVFGPGTTFNPLQRVFLDVDGRLAWLHSSGSQTFLVAQAIGPAFGANGSFSRDTVAYELGAMLGVEVVRNVELRAGYRYLMLRDAVFAPDLIAATDVVNAKIGPVSSRLSINAFTVGVRAVFP